MAICISIIIPVLNEASRVGGLLDSLNALRDNGHEVIIVDGGSQDGTLNKVNQKADQVLVSVAERATQMNAGAQVAQGEVLLFLHADTSLPDGADQLVKKALAESNRSWGRFDVKLSGHMWLLRLIERMMNWRSCLTGMVTGDQAMFVTRDLFKQINGFPDIPLMEDIAISRRLKRYSRPVCLHVPVVTSSQRWEQKGILRTVLMMWSLRLAYFLGVSPRRLVDIYYPSRRKA